MTSATTSLLNTHAGMNLLPMDLDLVNMHQYQHHPQLNFALELDPTDTETEGGCDNVQLNRNLGFLFGLGRYNETRSFTRSRLDINLKEKCFAKAHDPLVLWNDLLEDGMQKQIERFTRPTMHNFPKAYGNKELHFLYSLDSRKGGIHY